MDYAAHRAGMEVRSSGTAHGEVTKRETDELYAFVDIETALDVELEPPPGADDVRRLVAKAEHGCFVSNSLTARPRHRWVVNGQEVQ
jgi:organic hydroperoxide reductase OsmC/OhrA